MAMKNYFAALAVLAACAAAGSASAGNPTWPSSIVGTWSGTSNQSPIVLTVSSQASGSKCDVISGSIQDVNGGFSGPMSGYYCPSSGAVEFLRYPTGGNVPFQVYNANVSQTKPPKGEGILMGGVFSQYSLSFGPLGQYSFSLTN